MSSSRIFLVGLMGSGKTHFGKKIADFIGWNFIDLDQYIEEKEAMRIPQIFEKHGENHFRQLESKYLKEIVLLEQIVVATGGGTPCFHGNMEMMNRSGETWYLKITPATAAERVKHQIAERPLLKGKSSDDLVSFFTKQLKEREPFYARAKRRIHAEKMDERNWKEMLGLHG